MKSTERRGLTPTLVCTAIAFIAGVPFWSSISSPPQALAQLPDSGAQHAEMIAQQRLTNEKLVEVISLLTQIRDLQSLAGPPKVGAKPAAKTPQKP